MARSHGSWSVPIGRVFGVEIRVHVTFLLVVALFALGSSAPGGPGALAGVGWLLGIFACVLVHELAHSLVARRRGATVTAIVLLPIGGVSQLSNLPERPADEFAVAIVGPLASFAIAAGSGAVAWVLGQRLWPVDLADGPVVARLAWLNLILGAFNLLPAFPLDGGRVLRALLERRADLPTATRRAALVGKILAAAMVGVGLLVNWWLAIIGVFVFMGAAAEEAATLVHAALEHLRVRDLMLLDPVTVDVGTSLDDLARLQRRSAQDAFPVVDAGGYVGLVGAVEVEAGHPDITVGAVVDREAPALPADAGVEEVLETIGGSGYGALAVVEDGGVVGLLREADVVRVLRRASSSKQ